MSNTNRPDSFQVEPGLLVAFAATVREGSISAAAKSLGLSRPTLSRRLSTLEQRLGVALLHRSTRRVRPTPAGERLFARAAPALDALSAAAQAVRDEGEHVTGLVRVSVPPVLAPDLAVELTRLQRTHPDLRIALHAEVGWADLRADGVELAVRAGRLVDPELVQRRLGSADISAVAAPELLARVGTPDTPGGLAGMPLLLGPAGGSGHQRWWPLRGGGRVPVGGRFRCNDQRALLAAAVAGAGVALMSEDTAAADLTSGRLVRVLPAHVGTTMDLHLVFTRRTLQPARVRVAAAALVAWAARWSGEA
jgi:DNA-binding transcriptional LysR family regulator